MSEANHLIQNIITWCSYPESGKESVAEAIASGIDLSIVSYRGKDLLRYLLENNCHAHPNTISVLVENGCNPLKGALHHAIADEMAQSIEMMVLQSAQKNYTDATGAGLVEHILRGPLRFATIDALEHAAKHGADLTPPENTTWFHVLLENPRAFRPASFNVFSEKECAACWNIVHFLMDQGFDARERDHKGDSVIPELERRIEAGCILPLDPRVTTSLEAYRMEKATPLSVGISSAHRRM